MSVKSCKIIPKLRTLFVAVLLVGLMGVLRAQQKTGGFYIGRIMSRIPDSLTRSTDGLAGYVNANFTTPYEKSRAIFTWITRNIRYNFDSIITNSIYETPQEVSERILKSRVGVCLNFACLYDELSRKAGVPSCVIQGYTRQNGRVDYLPHVWCAAFIDSAWYLSDPSWGSGYFMLKPKVMIRSHMPFDPLWQFLNHPVTYDEFEKVFLRFHEERAFFDFEDTLQAYENSTELEKVVSAARRIELNGTRNSFTDAKLRVLKGQADYLRNVLADELYSQAVENYNEGINILNRFIQYRNEQFRRGADTLQLSQMLDSAECLFDMAVDILEGIKNPERNVSDYILQLRDAITNTRMALLEQRVYLKAKRGGLNR